MLLATVTVGTALDGCSVDPTDDPSLAATAAADLTACTAKVTKNTYDGPAYWGTISFTNGASAVRGITVAFDAPSGAHCTNDAVPAGATLSPLSGSGPDAATRSNHCVYTWPNATLAAGASKTFSYSTDSGRSTAASHVTVTFASCAAPAGADAGAEAAARDAAAGDATAGAATGGCAAPGLVWHSANKTSFTSYPAPGSAECIQYNGCAYEGQFAACPNTESLSWVKSHNIVSVFPNLRQASNGVPALALHDLCLRSGTKTIVVTALDECADSDCSGCCTQNKGSADELVDIESFTDARWGVEDGPIEWADLGATKTAGCN